MRIKITIKIMIMKKIGFKICVDAGLFMGGRAFLPAIAVRNGRGPLRNSL